MKNNIDNMFGGSSFYTADQAVPIFGSLYGTLEMSVKMPRIACFGQVRPDGAKRNFSRVLFTHTYVHRKWNI